MTEPKCFLAPITLLDRPPASLPVPRFQIGQRVCWSKVGKSADFGHIVGLVWATEGSVQAIGYHYSVLLDQDSPSSSVVNLDWAFEDDLTAMPVSNPSQSMN